MEDERTRAQSEVLLAHATRPPSFGKGSGKLGEAVDRHHPCRPVRGGMMLGPRHWRYRLRLRLRSLFRPRDVEQDLHDEIAFHLAMQSEANRQAGMRKDEARAEAARQFGGAT